MSKNEFNKVTLVIFVFTAIGMLALQGWEGFGWICLGYAGLLTIDFIACAIWSLFKSKGITND